MISELDLDYLKFDKRIQCRDKPIEINVFLEGINLKMSIVTSKLKVIIDERKLTSCAVEG